MQNKKKIAIIGSGISGISAAYLLSTDYNVSIFEKNNYFGGHTRTITVNDSGNHIDIDTGFIVFNEKSYPDLSNFFKILNIDIQDSEMSLSISSKKNNLEYSSKNIHNQIKNFKNVVYIKIIRDIIRFYKSAPYILKNVNIDNLSISDFFKKTSYSSDFLEYHIYPIASSIWSTDIKYIKDFPIKSFIIFFIENDLFNFLLRPKWKTLVNRGKSYIEKVLSKTNIESKFNEKVIKLIRNNNKITLISENNSYSFDEVVLATHADQALKIIANPTIDEKRILSKFTYNENEIFLHKDQNFMPKNKKIWSSWNFLGEKYDKFSLSYWMNSLQKTNYKENYFVTVNPINEIDNKLILNSAKLKHPIFNLHTHNAQSNLKKIQGVHGTWFAGSYFGYGHHEDGIQSSVSIALKKGIQIPWKRNIIQDNRIKILCN
ncbi:MAG: hypothetical protein CMI95_02740 [Pelagibacteraceae bacterium]|nr:hypothetical protein [Pelagibacteraceae bacterium]|tara:strand:+ start:25210 stop:26502 length:1293 start_codon:yes stop_codon:yes gene_type:complete